MEKLNNVELMECNGGGLLTYAFGVIVSIISFVKFIRGRR